MSAAGQEGAVSGSVRSMLGVRSQGRDLGRDVSHVATRLEQSHCETARAGIRAV
jgi:hypothetical protein